ncbi:MAG: PKD domain-containing protein [Phycisphaerae bacterium]
MIRKFFFNLMLILLSGCAVTQSQKVPHDPLLLTDPEFNRDYYIYLPSSFGKKPVPLVVTCHGTNPWDSARMQINEWKYLAEKNKFVVIAPIINSARGFIPPSPPEGTQILKDDERFILKIVHRFLNNINVDNRAIMITGWSAGGFATYYVGLRHPEIFRVVVARQANFVREYYPAETWRFNPWQPILIFYGDKDIPILKADSHVAYRFLKDAGQRNLSFQGLSGGHSRHPEVALEFFLNAVKKYPNPTIRSAKLYPGGQCRIKFDSGILGPDDTDDIFWDFGDGDSTPGKVVEHLYAKPGKYSLAVMRSYQNKINRFTGYIEINSRTLAVKPKARK